MTKFNRLFAAASGAQMFVFGELIRYVPSTGNERIVPRAIVHRSPPQPLDGAPGQHTPRLVVQVPCCPTTGISAAEIDVGSDQILVSLVLGGTPELHTITKLNAVRHGVTEFEVR